ncbi:MAG TPA: protein kinase, partial [Steroidobacter sp.]|nr:protein kinase [Steroidobacter sp.]
MSAFRTTLTDFCAGNAALPQLLAALRDDLLRDRQALFDDTALIDWAWRSGRVDPEVYQALRNVVTGFDISAPQPGFTQEQNWPEIRASHRDWEADAPDSGANEGDATLFRPSLSTPFNSVRQQSTPRPSAPSNRSWGTGSAPWSDAPAKDVGPGVVLKERFVLEEIIGRGGMGTVYKARDIRKEEAQDRYPFVAVKVLNEDFRQHPESLKALQREAKKSQSLAHPNVASVFDFDRDGAIVFLVMELLEGESLEQLIQDRAGHGLPRAEVLRIVRSAGAALAYAHHKGVVHSDFKPANAIRTRDGTIKVLDFGIARAITLPTGPGAETTRFNVTGLGALTPAYASCEMLIGEEAHPSDDVFALACVTYELLAGRHPFGHLSALLADRRGMKPIPIEGLDRRTWRALAAGLAFSRRDRTASVEEFLAELAPSHRGRLVAVASAAVLAGAGIGAWFYMPGLQNLDPRAWWSWIETKAAGVSLPRRTENTPAEPSTSESLGNASGPEVVVSVAPTNNALPSEPVGDTPDPDLPDAVQPTDDVLPSDPELADAAPPTNDVPFPTDSIPPATPEQSPAEQASPTDTPPIPTETEPEAAPPLESRPSNVEPRRKAPPREFSIEQRKERLIAFARSENLAEAREVLSDLQSRLDADDPFLRVDAPRAIAEVYRVQSERNFIAGRYSVALSLLGRAHDEAPDLTIIAVRREQMQQVIDLDQMLADGPIPSAEETEKRW